MPVVVPLLAVLTFEGVNSMSSKSRRSFTGAGAGTFCFSTVTSFVTFFFLCKLLEVDGELEEVVEGETASELEFPLEVGVLRLRGFLSRFEFLF